MRRAAAATGRACRCGDLAVREAELRRPHLTDQTSIIRFIEDNWLGGQRIGQGSFDAIRDSITNMLDFKNNPFFGNVLFLDPDTGEDIFNY